MEARLDNTIAVIPSYNEVRTIGEIVRGIISMGMTVLVIDDGSGDNTERVALDNGALVIRQKTNVGKGFSIRSGILHVLKKTNFEWMVILDGDGQHQVEDILALMDATKTPDVDIVLGNRMLETKNMPPVRYLTNKFMSWMLSKMCGQYLPDTQCGFRLFGREALGKMRLISDKYDIESEILIEAAKNDLKIRSVPIRTIYGEEVSEIHPGRDTIRFIKLILHYFSNTNK